MFWLMAPIKKLLIEIDLSGSTLIVLLNGKILLFIFKLNLLRAINLRKIVFQNNALLL